MAQVWSNWSGEVKCSPKSIEKPSDIEGVRRLVKRVAGEGGRLRVVGSGHSFTALVETNETLLSLDEWQGIDGIDREKLVADVRAGSKLWWLGDELLKAGYAQENLGDINRQSIAGAVSTGTHGTGLGFGNIPTQAVGLTLVTADGEVVECDEERERDLYLAARVSMGALGVIVRAKLRVVPAYRLHYVRKRSTMRETRERIAEYRDRHRHFELYYFPHTDRVQLKFLDAVDSPPSTRPIRKYMTDVLLENTAFGLMSEATRVGLLPYKTTCRICAAAVSESEEIDHSHRVFSTSRHVRFVEMEYGVPAERGFECLEEIAAWIKEADARVHFPIEFRYVKGDDAWISPSHGRDTVFISIHQYVGMDYREYFEGVERIFRRYDGRPHWGKKHTLGPEELRPLYPKWDDFHALRRRLDPKGVFMNPYLERVFGDRA